MGDRMLRMGVGLLVGVWVARYLGPAYFGTFNYAFAIVTIVGGLASLGLDSVVVREVLKQPQDTGEILGTSFALKLAAGIAGVFLVIATIRLLQPDDPLTQSVAAVLALGMLFQSLDPIDFWFQSQVQARYVVMARNGAFLTLAAVKVLLIVNGAPLLAFAWAATGEAALAAVGLTVVYHRRGLRLFSWSGATARARGLLASSWPQIAGGLAILIYMRIDQVMLGQMLGASGVGIYSAAVRVSEVWYFIPSAVVASVLPSIIAAHKEDGVLYWRRIEQLQRWLVRMAYAIAVPVTFLGESVIVALFGADYAAAGTVLTIHIWAAVFVFMGVGQGPWFLAEDMLRVALQRTIAGAVVNVALNLVLIPVWGVIGAAVATVLSYAVSAFLVNGLDRRTRSLFLVQVRALWPLPVR
jgi:polysaccharide transporter, PST family